MRYYKVLFFSVCLITVLVVIKLNLGSSETKSSGLTPPPTRPIILVPPMQIPTTHTSVPPNVVIPPPTLDNSPMPPLHPEQVKQLKRLPDSFSQNSHTSPVLTREQQERAVAAMERAILADKPTSGSDKKPFVITRYIPPRLDINPNREVAKKNGKVFGVLDSSSSGLVFVSTDYTTFNSFKKAFLEHRYEEMSRIQITGLMFPVSPGTEAFILTDDSVEAKVFITSGPHVNKQGWILSVWFKPETEL